MTLVSYDDDGGDDDGCDGQNVVAQFLCARAQPHTQTHTHTHAHTQTHTRTHTHTHMQALPPMNNPDTLVSIRDAQVSFQRLNYDAQSNAAPRSVFLGWRLIAHIHLVHPARPMSCNLVFDFTNI